ncbi:MAG: hypothetical protein J6Z11_14170, partial [Candidatus Riflebacteria bacterium]|nr:hypothetical protein [Candidatus Riflebacteria bacterium]
MILLLVFIVIGFYCLSYKLQAISCKPEKGISLFSLQSACYSLTIPHSSLLTPNYIIAFVSLALLTLFIPYPAFAHPSFNVNSGLKALEAGDLDTAESFLQKARF